jgi:hypothetical protein
LLKIISFISCILKYFVYSLFYSQSISILFILKVILVSSKYYEYSQIISFILKVFRLFSKYYVYSQIISFILNLTAFYSHLNISHTRFVNLCPSKRSKKDFTGQAFSITIHIEFFIRSFSRFYRVTPLKKYINDVLRNECKSKKPTSFDL